MQNSVPNSRAKRHVFGCFATLSEHFPTKIACQVSWQSFSTEWADSTLKAKWAWSGLFLRGRKTALCFPNRTLAHIAFLSRVDFDKGIH
nr:hypothetical protein [uncultured Celeribacter sp.]